jgi:hypothetical protein
VRDKNSGICDKEVFKENIKLSLVTERMLFRELAKGTNNKKEDD